MFKNITTSILAILFIFHASAQDKWDLRRCVEYARANNISVKQTDLQTRFSEITYKQSKQSQIPSLGFSNNYSWRYGRVENPSTGILTDNNIFNISFGLSSQVSIFNWFSKKNTIESDRLSVEADKAEVQKVQDDISINVAVAYLQILLSREQVNLAKVQVQLTQDLLNTTRKKVDAGVLPELNAAELEAQLSRDSSNLISSETSVEQFLLQMKALLNLDAGFAFDIGSPDIEKIPLDNLADLLPENVYAQALVNLPQQKVIDFRIQSAKKSVEAARGQMYPSIGGFAQMGSNFVNYKDRPVYDQVITGYSTSSLRANAGSGVYYPVETPQLQQSTNVIGYIKPDHFGPQLNSNFSQGFGIGLSVPIFNSGSLKNNWERSKLFVKQWELTKELDNQTLKQNIYRAYNDATASLQKFNADSKSVETAKKSYDFAQKRYDLNLLSTFDLINSQNNLLSAKIQALYSQYDYVFKMKLLEFYKGQGIRL
jgi:outer membrane protein